MGIHSQMIPGYRLEQSVLLFHRQPYNTEVL